jgi:ATP-dependent protease ClpP protease subunit
MRPCFVFNQAPDDKPGSLSIYDEIGFWGTQAKDFQASLSAITAKDVHVEINSPGGDYFAGLAMYNMLRSSGKTITTKVMGVAASAATIVFAAGDVREMPKNTMLMVHNPSTWGGGTAQDHREQADMLDKIAVGARSVYVRNSSLTDEDVSAMLEKDTWLSADEALTMGLSTIVTDEIKATASFDMARADLPESVKAIYAKASQIPPQSETPAPIPETVPEVIPEGPVATAIHELAVKANLQGYSAFMAIACDSVESAQARIKTASEIVALCNYAKKPEAAGPAICANKTVADVRALILAEFADADVHTSNVRKVDDKPVTAQSGSTASIWQAHRAQSKVK